ncbi:MAG: M6 family metalloprotease domain-containing protein [Prevotella sp.]
MKKTLLTIIAIVMTVVANAAPALKEWRTFTQSDGTTIKVMLCGDETMHYYVTEDMVPLVRTKNGDFCYAAASGFSVTSTGVLAHEAPLRTIKERSAACKLEQLQETMSWKRQSMDLHRAKNAAKTRLMAQQNRANALPGETVKRKGLVIMVSFSDVDFSSENAHQVWSDILSKEGYSENDANGCVSEYFRDQSNGQLDISFDLVGPYKLPKEQYYYGATCEGDNTKWDDYNAGEMVVAACKEADKEVNFADYDWDGDGYVEQIYVLYAGTTAARTGNNQNLIWPHEWELGGYPDYRDGLKLDGVTVWTYAIGSELLNLESKLTPLQLSGLGTFCHEFSHCLGLPDLYSTNGAGGQVLNSWNLLDNGCYNNMGWNPPNYSAYEREMCGWDKVPVISSPCSIENMGTLNATREAYKIVNDRKDGSTDECYVLEVRAKDGWDSHTVGEGLLVYHIDYVGNIWETNTVNCDYTHPHFTLISADNTKNVSAGNPYPYNNNDSLTNASFPRATVYNTTVQDNKFMNKPITNIRYADGKASFDFCGGDPTGIVSISDTQDRQALKGQAVTIYSLSGKKVMEVEQFDGFLPLQQGTYIVKGKERSMKISF